MMMRPLVVTTSTHPAALAFYCTMGWLGVINTSSLQTPRSMVDIVGSLGAVLWAWLLGAAGVTAFVGALLGARQRYLTLGLVIEAWGCGAIGVALLLYEAALIKALGTGALTTQVLIVGLALAGLLRARQARRELKKVRRGRQDPHPADPPPLGDPADDNG